MLQRLFFTVTLVLLGMITPAWAEDAPADPPAAPVPNREELKIIAVMEILQTMDLVETMELMEDLDVLIKEESDDDKDN